ncbi:MAG: ATPase domain-containing protein [Candidatus Nezhaarchaeota archaeon]|nr:ATPase domain-containing protein [Candidatus Nezhaarchaeota archaeon]
MSSIKLKLGLSKIDEALNGGLDEGEVTLLFGEAGSGKTALALQLALRSCLEGLKVLYVYMNGFFPYPRIEAFMKEIGVSPEALSSKFHVSHLTKLDDLVKLIRTIELGHLDHDLLIFDTITSLYRSLDVKSRHDIVLHNKKLNQLTAILKNYIIESKRRAVLTSRLKTFSIGEELIDEPIASNILTYWSDNIISIHKLDVPLQRKVVLLKIHGHESNVEIAAHVVNGFLKEVD